MNEEQVNRYSGCVFRISFLLKMVDNEVNYFSQFRAPSGIKGEFVRLSKVYESGMRNIVAYMPNAKNAYLQHIEQSEERISAMCSIFEKLALVDDKTMFRLENDFNENVKVNYQDTTG